MLLKQIPNLLTSANIACGCIASVFVFKNEMLIAFWLFSLALVFDFLDGFSARLLKAYSEIGKQLDSLADLISFGFLPSLVLFKVLEPQNLYLAFTAFLVCIFSAWRLARFNIDESQSTSFKGLPTPANALLIMSLPMIVWQIPPSIFYITNPFFIISLILISCFLLVSNISLFSLKLQGFSWQKNKLQYIFLLISITLISFFWFLSIPIIIVLYLLLSLVRKP